ncbi:MAG: class I SAM-dependent methyltransferase [Phycisphaerales bacterium]|nr:class I SAM-dependent methyltransferase [Phycisphaerae bacterium]NNF42548.1 class I SAM-dependent methyltransferase [Phycisphaerales bacterium]NNM25090.1 class I SAM-dependent methyltransferase [Phycisphaerales bacterium]
MTHEAWQADDPEPFEPEQHAAQLAGLVRLLGPPPRRGLDLGCGPGRILVPLAAEGHRMIGLDRDPSILTVCEDRLARAGATAELHAVDFQAAWPSSVTDLDFVLCLGNTFAILADVDAAVAMLQRVASVLAPGGVFLMDDLAADLWPELTEGYWCSGVSDDGTAQIIWHPSDAIFALRHGDAVDDRSWTFEAGDQPLRLWTDGALRLAAAAGGLSGPEREDGAHLIVMRRGANPTAG